MADDCSSRVGRGSVGLWLVGTCGFLVFGDGELLTAACSVTVLCIVIIISICYNMRVCLKCLMSNV